MVDRTEKLKDMGALLSQKEVDELPDGSKVKIIWSGGNGPFEYEIGKRYGKSYVKNCYEDYIDLVTTDKTCGLTMVSLVR